MVPKPPGLDTPRGSLHLADELYVCERNRAGREWGKGAMLSNGEQAEILKDWLGRWGLTPQRLADLHGRRDFCPQRQPKRQRRR